MDEVSKVAKCSCVEDCGYEPDPRRKVCTNFNETFSSDCEVHQLRCFCEEGIAGKCSDAKKYSHVHVEYFGN